MDEIKSKSATYTLKIETIRRLNEYCEKEGYVKSNIVNKAIMQYIDRMEQKEKTE